MPLDIIVGAQWGDEGKGRITDLLADEADLVARFSGGDNAGHTVTVGEKIFKLHLIPSGIVQPRTLCLMGSGMVINPSRLLDEIEMLAALGVDVSPRRLKISHAAHIITPAHLALDAAEEARRGSAGLGTTLRGIGPAYADKTARRGVRAESMENPEAFGAAVADQVRRSAEIIEKIYHSAAPDPQQTRHEYTGYAERLRPHLADVGALVSEALDNQQTVLAEGAQGCLLDLDHGTYPYVTSSHPTTAGVLLGLGIGPNHLRRVIGVTKAFQTRVGSGPMPTELQDQTAAHLRGSGANPWDEFGTTTGRPRRCGWLDGVLLRYAARINGFRELVITKLDILSGLETIRICQAYQAGDQQITSTTGSAAALESASPDYLAFPGWTESLWDVRRWEDLPTPAQLYIRQIETLSALPVTMISVGPERQQVILRSG